MVSRAGAKNVVAGIELGGTKCICTLGTAAGDVLDQLSIPTLDPDITLPLIVARLSSWDVDSGIAAIGIGSFGPLDLDRDSPSFGRIGCTSKPGWSGVDVLSRITDSFDVPWRIDTDVNAAAIAEHRWGAGVGTDRFAYVTVGTGVGVGFPPSNESGEVWHAELGHVRVSRADNDGLPSVCPYHDDCVEGLASGAAVALAMAGANPADVPFDDPRWGGPVESLGQLAHSLCCAMSPQRIAFGGGVIVGNPGLLTAVEASMRRSLNGYLPLPEKEPLLVPAALGNQAGPRGTLALAETALIIATRQNSRTDSRLVESAAL